MTNVATGFTAKTLSNSSGNYYAPFLVPGTYRISVAKEGFKTFIREGIVLNVNDRLEINATLAMAQAVSTIRSMPVMCPVH